MDKKGRVDSRQPVHFLNLSHDAKWCKMVQLTIRKTISFSPKLAREILERAKEYHRSFSAQVAHDMREMIDRESINLTMRAEYKDE